MAAMAVVAVIPDPLLHAPTRFANDISVPFLGHGRRADDSAESLPPLPTLLWGYWWLSRRFTASAELGTAYDEAKVVA